MEIETIKIKDDNKRGFKTINKCDFIEGTHKEYSDKPKRTTRTRKKKVEDGTSNDK